MNKFIAVDEMNAKYLQMRDRLKAEARAEAQAREAGAREAGVREADRAPEPAGGDGPAAVPAAGGTNGHGPGKGNGSASGNGGGAKRSGKGARAGNLSGSTT
ncbi:oxidase [Streptomyces alboflavus]|uniref:Oxidase n=1 Tax=Streptomyces alboflavus TaxID=67267 RepID=A0A1Z1WNL6_9ACTN|nr:hypothetical protein [Streptomyces alboflavus]ARX87970.1 oxidase [Streptomyces alboflavus]